MEIESIVDKVDTNKIEKLTLIGGFIFTIMGGVYFVANYLYNQRCSSLLKVSLSSLNYIKLFNILSK